MTVNITVKLHSKAGITKKTLKKNPPPTPAGVRAQHLRRLRETRVEQLWRCFRPESVTFDRE